MGFFIKLQRIKCYPRPETLFYFEFADGQASLSRTVPKPFPYLFTGGWVDGWMDGLMDGIPKGFFNFFHFKIY